MNRNAYTLMEVVIALGIFMGLMVSIMQTMIGTNRLVIDSAIKDDVQFSSHELTRNIATDMSTSGWFFPGSEDTNANGILDLGEDLNGNSTLDDFVFNINGANASADRALRYYPFVNVPVAGLYGAAFYRRKFPSAGGGGVSGGFWETSQLSPTVAQISRNPLSLLSPYSGLTTTQIVAAGKRMGIAVPSDLANEMASPSADLVFLRVATGPWRENPNDSSSDQRSDMLFFPGYINTGTGPTPLPGETAQAWNTPGNHDNLPRIGTRNTVLYPSEFGLDVATGYIYHNATATTAATDPYGVRAWGARLDDSSGGMVLRIQWETITADRMDLDPETGTDNTTPTADLREFVYAILPSPIGLGRMVRAHSVVSSGTRRVGVEVGDWISDPTQTRGWVIDRVMSDDVVRIQWWTRRHDRNLQPNQVRARIILARVSGNAVEAQRELIWREVIGSFTMWAQNEYQDVKDAQTLIDVSNQASDGTNVRLSY